MVSITPMEIVAFVKSSCKGALSIFNSFQRTERILIVAGLGFLLTMMTLLAIFHNAVLHWLAVFSDKFREIKFNWVIVLIAYTIVAFPPMVGYSVVSLFTGMVYGFPNGWPVIAVGTLLSSFLSFMVFRYLLSDRAQDLARKNIKFTAFVEALRQDSFVLLWMIRLCPLPYSLSNAAMSSVPSVLPWKFFLATLCCTPKLLIHIFIGSRLVKLSDTSDTAQWWINFLSVVLTVIVTVFTSYIIYKRTKEKAEALQNMGTGSLNNPEVDDFEISDGESDDYEVENPFSSSNNP